MKKTPLTRFVFVFTMLSFALLLSHGLLRTQFAFGNSSDDGIIKMVGRVKSWISYIMFEDFWLQTHDGQVIPVVVRFAGLPVPPKDSDIEVVGIMEYSTLEGGFYYLDAQSWSYVASAPEFPSLLILSVFMMVGLVAAVALKKPLARRII